MEKKHTFAVMSFARQNKHNKGADVSANLRITIDGKRSEISTKTIIPKDKWLPGKGRVKGTGEEARHLNLGIITFEHRAREIYNRFIEQGKTITVESVKNELLASHHKQRMLLKQFSLGIVLTITYPCLFSPLLGFF